MANAEDAEDVAAANAAKLDAAADAAEFDENVVKDAYVAPKAIAPKKEKKEKKEDSAGISPAERDELEKLKVEIVAKKTALKEQGMSGGQQNKDPDVVKMVTR